MNTSTEVMEKFVKNDLIRHYSSFEGWVINSPKPKDRYDQVYTISRSRGGNTEKCFVGVSFAPIVPQTLIAQLTAEIKKESRNVKILGEAILVPNDTDTTNIPKNIEVLRMRHFAYKEKNLVWLKKPERTERAKNLTTETQTAN